MHQGRLTLRNEILLPGTIAVFQRGFLGVLRRFNIEPKKYSNTVDVEFW